MSESELSLRVIRALQGKRTKARSILACAEVSEPSVSAQKRDDVAT